jgi:hypothetical protein
LVLLKPAAPAPVPPAARAAAGAGKTVLKVLAFVIGIVVFGVVALIVIAVSMFPSSPATTTSQTGRSVSSGGSVSHVNDGIAVTPQRLYAAYEANEVAADEEYKGKLVRVSGTIEDIGKDILDSPYVKFEGTNSLFGVQAMFPKSAASQLARLQKNQFLTVQCTVTGKLGNVLLKNCVIP